MKTDVHMCFGVMYFESITKNKIKYKVGHLKGENNWEKVILHFKKDNSERATEWNKEPEIFLLGVKWKRGVSKS